MKTVERTGVVAELDGEYWYEDHDGPRGWGPIEGSQVSNPAYCRAATDKLSQNDEGCRHWKQLARAKLVPVRIVTTYYVGEECGGD